MLSSPRIAARARVACAPRLHRLPSLAFTQSSTSSKMSAPPAPVTTPIPWNLESRQQLSPSVPPADLAARAKEAQSEAAGTLASLATLPASMPLVGFGTWRSLPGEVTNAVHIALTKGKYRLVDCAWIYVNQTEVGEGLRRALADASSATGTSPRLTRSDIFLTSKVWMQHYLPADVEWSTRDTLSQLGVDYVDLMLLHWPFALKNLPGNKFSETPEKDDHIFEDVPLIETWRALESLVDRGLIRFLGGSNFSIHELEHLLQNAKYRPVNNQVELHPYFNQRELVQWCHRHNITVTAYSPLGNLQRNDHEKDNAPLNDPVIVKLAQEYGVSPAQVILRWHLQNGHLVVPKSVSEARIIENANLFHFELSADAMQAIDALGARKVRFMNPPFGPKNSPWFKDEVAKL